MREALQSCQRLQQHTYSSWWTSKPQEQQSSDGGLVSWVSLTVLNGQSQECCAHRHAHKLTAGRSLRKRADENSPLGKSSLGRHNKTKKGRQGGFKESENLFCQMLLGLFLQLYLPPSPAHWPSGWFPLMRDQEGMKKAEDEQRASSPSSWCSRHSLTSFLQGRLHPFLTASSPGSSTKDSSSSLLLLAPAISIAILSHSLLLACQHLCERPLSPIPLNTNLGVCSVFFWDFNISHANPFFLGHNNL